MMASLRDSLKNEITKLFLPPFLENPTKLSEELETLVAIQNPHSQVPWLAAKVCSSYPLYCSYQTSQMAPWGKPHFTEETGDQNFS